MRYIDRSLFENCKTDTWDSDSNTWTEQLRQSDDPVGKIKTIGNKWSLLKSNFVEEFGAKCWYTEAPQIATDCDMDHFFPKGRVKNIDGYIVTDGNNIKHPGYWWKAYDINNYRHSSVFSNRARAGGGKVDCFPLLDESRRSWGGEIGDYEYRLILDPCNLNDVQLITFEIEPGRTHPVVDLEDDSDGYLRVVKSRELLNLDHDTIVPHRLKVIKETQSHIRYLKLFHGLSIGELDEDNINGAEEIKQLLINNCSRKSPFSAAAIECVLPYRNEEYLEDIISDIDLTP
jgi:hypothetical protein